MSYLKKERTQKRPKSLVKLINHLYTKGSLSKDFNNNSFKMVVKNISNVNHKKENLISVIIQI